MTKLALFSTTTLCAVALMAAPAFAKGAPLVGFFHAGFDWTNYDPEVGSDFDTRTYTGQGAFQVPLDGGWTVDGNFSFESAQNDDLGPIDLAIDTWQIGTVIGYRWANEWRLGFDVAYQNIDVAINTDGYRLGARADWFWMPNATVHATVGFNNFEGFAGDVDGWYGGLGLSYYFTPNLAVRADFEDYEYDFGTPFDVDVWSLGAKLKYKCDDYPIVLGGGVEYADIDEFTGINTTAWKIGIDITALFGHPPDATIHDVEANGAWEPTRIGSGYPF